MIPVSAGIFHVKNADETLTSESERDTMFNMTNLLDLTAAERVANGSRWLDENFPGWVERIDPNTLRLSNTTKCICGQVFADQGDSYGGFRWAEKNLFSEANSWISAFCGAAIGVKSSTELVDLPLEEYDAYNKRVADVGFFLGFQGHPALAHRDSGFAPQYEELQTEWLKVLAERNDA